MPDDNNAAFFRFTMAIDSNIRLYYNSVDLEAKHANTAKTWKAIVDLNINQFASTTTQPVISSRRNLLMIDDAGEERGEEYEEIDKHTKHINQWVHMVRTKYGKDGTIVRFLATLVERMECALSG